MVGADVFIGLSGPGVVKVDDLGAMHRDAIVFAMANPTPEIMPEEAGKYVKVMATGRSDYPNQINNSCGFPGFFKGLFDVRARRVNDEMKLAAAHALANIVSDSELGEEYITPSMFDARVVPAVTSAVADAAVQTQGGGGSGADPSSRQQIAAVPQAAPVPSAHGRCWRGARGLVVLGPACTSSWPARCSGPPR